MSNHVGYVVAVNELREHPNADRMLIATFFGIDTCVGINTQIGDIGIYFPSDLQLSEEFCDANHLCRKTATGEPDTGYLDRDKRNVTAIKLRGFKSDGIYMPLECLAYTGVSMDTINIGDTIEMVNGHEICRKYIPRGRQHRQGSPSEGNRTRKKKVDIAPLFAEHADTEQLAYNMNAFAPGDEIEITLKMHGTSQRTGYLPVATGEFVGPGWAHFFAKMPFLKGLYNKAIDALKPVYNWGYVSGTRRTVLNDWEGGFYGSNKFREQHAKVFEGKLRKGEEVFYEVVGFTDTGVPIMGDCANKKLNDKDFVKQYGETTTFSYGCAPNGEIVKYGVDENGSFAIPFAVPQSDLYVYRMTMTNEDGDVVEYTPDFMRYRCEQMGVKTVPVFWRGILREPDDWCGKEWNAGEFAKMMAENFYDGPDPVGKTHVREGVVVRITNKPKFCAYKHKNWSFKCLEGLVKADAEIPDMEEAEDVVNEEG